MSFYQTASNIYINPYHSLHPSIPQTAWVGLHTPLPLNLRIQAQYKVETCTNNSPLQIITALRSVTWSRDLYVLYKSQIDF